MGCASSVTWLVKYIGPIYCGLCWRRLGVALWRQSLYGGRAREKLARKLRLSKSSEPNVQAFSGHESVGMVLRYAHAQDRAVDRALDRMDERTVVEHLAARTPADS